MILLKSDLVQTGSSIFVKMIRKFQTNSLNQQHQTYTIFSISITFHLASLCFGKRNSASLLYFGYHASGGVLNIAGNK